MTHKQYYFCVASVANYSDPAAYVSDLALSSIWGDVPDAPIPPERQEQLRSIYTAATRTVREILSAAGLTQAAASEQLFIPRRTLQDWVRGIAKCPLYTRLMMQQCLDLFVPPVQ